MTRRIWIVALASLLAAFVGASGYLFSEWIQLHRWPTLGWMLVASDALLLWIALGYLRFRLHEARQQAASTRDSAESLGNLADVSRAGAAAAAHDLGTSPAPFHS